MLSNLIYCISLIVKLLSSQTTGCNIVHTSCKNWSIMPSNSLFGAIFSIEGMHKLCRIFYHLFKEKSNWNIHHTWRIYITITNITISISIAIYSISQHLGCFWGNKINEWFKWTETIRIISKWLLQFIESDWAIRCDHLMN